MKVFDVVKYFIHLHKQQIAKIKETDGFADDEGITHLKMQKLLYYAQGISLVYGNPLFDNDIQAWQHGPVVKEVYDELKQYGKSDLQDIQALQYTDDTLSIDDKTTIEITFREYGRYTTLHLRDKTHVEPTWIKAFSRGNNTIISQQAMSDFFKKVRKEKAHFLYLKSK